MIPLGGSSSQSVQQMWIDGVRVPLWRNSIRIAAIIDTPRSFQNHFNVYIRVFNTKRRCWITHHSRSGLPVFVAPLLRGYIPQGSTASYPQSPWPSLLEFLLEVRNGRQAGP